MASQKLSGRAASMARRQMQVAGKAAVAGAAAHQSKTQAAAPVATTRTTHSAKKAASNPAGTNQNRGAREASRARRMAMSAHGKAGVKTEERQRTAKDLRQSFEQPKGKEKCNCGGECCSKDKESTQAKKSAGLMSSNFDGAKKRVVKKQAITTQNTGRLMAKARRSAMSSKGKTGQEAHRKGISSASLARQANPEISSRELARAVRDQRSRIGAKGTVNSQPSRRQKTRSTSEKGVSGTRLSHSEKLTGDEAGLCHSGVTGTEYMGSEVFEKFCKSEPLKYPEKVHTSETLQGSHITTGGRVGGSERITGGDQGSCRSVTGNEYLGREHFATQCDSVPAAGPAKVSSSHTQRGTVVSGPKPSRIEKITGNEKGTCKAVTGTPYTSFEDFKSFCSTEDQQLSRERQKTVRMGVGRDISGTQPGINGEHVTGSEAGACQAISGTPYLGMSEMRQACSAEAALPSDDDYPQSLNETAPPAMQAPQPAPSQVLKRTVTGAGYEGPSAITGAFSMGSGKVTGTENARFGERNKQAEVVTAMAAEEPTTSRVTGEGIDTGLRITGDDWDRGDRVTGTEGGSVVQRNPTRRGPTSAMPSIVEKREPKRERPSAPVTGGSGGSDGANVTVTGGARG